VQLFAPPARKLEGHAHGAFDLWLGVGRRVYRAPHASLVLPVFFRAREIGTGDELADEEHICALDDFRLQRRKMHQRLLHPRWPQVRKSL
jgi:hypothetical protein